MLEAQQQLFLAENALSLVEASRRLVMIQLCKALGDGWNLDDNQWTDAWPMRAIQKVKNR
jgi:hypothetical protein